MQNIQIPQQSPKIPGNIHVHQHQIQTQIAQYQQQIRVHETIIKNHTLSMSSPMHQPPQLNHLSQHKGQIQMQMNTMGQINPISPNLNTGVTMHQLNASLILIEKLKVLIAKLQQSLSTGQVTNPSTFSGAPSHSTSVYTVYPLHGLVEAVHKAPTYLDEFGVVKGRDFSAIRPKTVIPRLQFVEQQTAKKINRINDELSIPPAHIHISAEKALLYASDLYLNQCVRLASKIHRLRPKVPVDVGIITKDFKLAMRIIHF